MSRLELSKNDDEHTAAIEKMFFFSTFFRIYSE